MALKILDGHSDVISALLSAEQTYTRNLPPDLCNWPRVLGNTWKG